MASTLGDLRCATFKLSERTRQQIQEIKEDRMKQDNTLFGFSTPLTNTDVLRFLIERECYAIKQRAAAAAEADQKSVQRKVKTEKQRQRRQTKKVSAK